MRNKIKKYFHRRIIWITIIFSFFNTSCKKDWLEAKSDITLTIPTTIKDMQALLDNTSVINVGGQTLGEIGSDNIYLTSSAWTSLVSSTERLAFVWDNDIYQQSQALASWNDTYKRIYYCNTVLENISKIEASTYNIHSVRNIQGSALFYRAFAFYDIVSIFAPLYDATTAGNNMGIPLRLSSDFNVQSVRSSVTATYGQILNDLYLAKELLPEIPLYKTHPSKPAVYGMLARVFLSMQEYDTAKLYADSCLRLNNSLMNFNSLTATSAEPIPAFNLETIYFNGMATAGSLRNSNVDTTLYRMYTNDDLRKNVFFSGALPVVKFKGTYTQRLTVQFNGLATDELYLIRAECLARVGNKNDAMDDLNKLLQSRWKTGTFIPYTATDADDALRQILTERRKELLYRGLRWTDLRRLNKDPRFAVTLTRNVNNTVYSLPPNDLRYVQLFPPDVIQYSGMEQNPR